MVERPVSPWPRVNLSHQGRNVSGVTSTFRSVAKLDQELLANGSILNIRVSPELCKNENGLRNFALMLRTFCENGGNLVQFNFTSNEMLREARNSRKIQGSSRSRRHIQRLLHRTVPCVAEQHH
ncbi:MAG: glycine radical domain-containing protein [Neglectibacter sp.]